MECCNNVKLKDSCMHKVSITLTGIVIITGLCVLLLWLSINLGYAGDCSILQYQVITVQQNDTLWSIAKEHYPNRDPRRVIWHIRKLNDCGTVVYPGELLKIPVL